MVVEDITAKEMADRIGVTERTVRNTMVTLIEKGLVERIGSKKTGRWVRKNRI